MDVIHLPGNMRAILIGLILILGVDRGAGQTTPTPPSVCQQNADAQCTAPFAALIQQQPPPALDIVCRAVDVMVGCTANVLNTCDPLVAAQVAEGIKVAIIRTFGPNTGTNCQLGNSSLPVYTSPCYTGINLCFYQVLSNAEPVGIDPAQIDPVRGCLFYDGFTRCVANELSNCTQAVLSRVQTEAAAAATKFNSDPYNCNQRGGDVKVQECIGIVQNSVTVMARDDLCRLYNDTRIGCVEEAKALATSPDQATQVQNTFDAFAVFLNENPFFCQYDNPCIGVFASCNATRTSTGVTKPCDLLAIYDVCMSQTVANCPNNADRTEVIAYINLQQTKTNQQFKCSGAPPTGAPTPSPCDQVAATCQQTFQKGMGAAAGNRDLVCAEIDKLLGCLTAGSEQCDVISKIELIGAVQPVLTFYTDPQNGFQCTLQNASSPALQLDQCARGIFNCTQLLFQARNIQIVNVTTVIDACINYDSFQACQQAETTSCDDVRLNALDEVAVNASRDFSANPYHCDERKQYDIDGVLGSFGQCYNTFQQGSVAATSLETSCKAVRDFQTCFDGVKPNASPRLLEQFQTDFTDLTAPYRQAPYLCNTADHCRPKFDECVTSQSNPQPSPCQMIPILNACLSDLSCSDFEVLNNVTDYVITQTQLIEQQNSCATTSSTPAISTTTTTTTTTRPPTTSAASAATTTTTRGTTTTTTSTTATTSTPTPTTTTTPPPPITTTTRTTTTTQPPTTTTRATTTTTTTTTTTEPTPAAEATATDKTTGAASVGGTGQLGSLAARSQPALGLVALLIMAAAIFM